MRNYIIGYKNNQAVIYSEKEIIDNALQQEKEGIEPTFAPRYNPKLKGWLVWSTMRGAGMVYRRHDGKMIILEGFQGDFVCC